MHNAQRLLFQWMAYWPVKNQESTMTTAIAAPLCHPQVKGEVCRFLFRPMQCDSTLKKVAAVATLAFLTVTSFGFWLIPFAIGRALTTSRAVTNSTLEGLDANVLEALRKTPAFKDYSIKFAPGSRYEGAVLGSGSLRPSNFFFSKLFERSGITTTLPRSGRLFAFEQSHGFIRNYIASQDPNRVVDVSARGFSGDVRLKNGRTIPCRFTDIYGDKTYQISLGEIQQMLASQKIFLAPELPVRFYKGLKAAMLSDRIITVPDAKLRNATTPNVRHFLQQVETNPLAYGFNSLGQYHGLKELTFYQIGSLVVKTEDYRTFVDGNMKIKQRRVGENDAINLINACGIRPSGAGRDPHNDPIIIKSMFNTALASARSGDLIVPAVGMGVWGGDPNDYWRGFLDAVAQNGSSLEHIFVNPRHQPTRSGVFTGAQGEEFQTLLDMYISTCQDPRASQNLRKIVNLYDTKQDVMQLAVNLKKNSSANHRVSLINASDPDVTLGYHVGEYVNNSDIGKTTEENDTAMGTNGLCFEGITNIHRGHTDLSSHNSRIIQIMPSSRMRARG
jgi:hypothetical protein